MRGFACDERIVADAALRFSAPDSSKGGAGVHVDINGNFDAFLSRRSPTARYASFDYCFNYFQDARDAGEAGRLAAGSRLELSCLHLGFYLASWGMMRGSGGLHGRSLQGLAPVVRVIASEPSAMWDLDVPGYPDGGIDEVLALGDRIREAYGFTASPILVTKTLLGVFGCVPAFDRFFRLGFGGATLTQPTLTRISDFYLANKNLLDAMKVRTLDFATQRDTPRYYTRAKIIDMIIFQEGYKLTGKVRP
jgi:hypothetical protein